MLSTLFKFLNHLTSERISLSSQSLSEGNRLAKTTAVVRLDCENTHTISDFSFLKFSGAIAERRTPGNVVRKQGGSANLFVPQFLQRALQRGLKRNEACDADDFRGFKVNLHSTDIGNSGSNPIGYTKYPIGLDPEFPMSVL